MGVAKGIGVALRGFGRALAKKGDGKAIKSVPIAKNLTKKRKATDSAFKNNQVWKDRAKASGWSQDPYKKITSDSIKRRHARDTKYENIADVREKKRKSHNRKVIGAGAATITGAVGGLEVGKRKSPKFKKFIESDVVIKDGKLGLRPKKKK